MVKKIPALICPVCGEAYFDETTSSRVDVIVGEALRGGGVGPRSWRNPSSRRL